ncbi:carbamoyltransferase HypF [Teredinibacter haidensis]|uniref:carbamoyltransferase HypF n=1 Tax=Teredinibacter haidensis TaxID=2731755 RepID=UPI0009488D15|nr:carbamoyltransferase HypF [Teredinibacter haidensis]
MIARHYILGGLVQGVGFRPFVHGLATKLNLNGWVQNVNGRVLVLVEGDEAAITQFEQRLITDAPPLAKPTIRDRLDKTVHRLKTFVILGSDAQANTHTISEIHLPADLYCCPDCQWELLHDDDRRHCYAFINCTQCGPRYTIIDELPYDRCSTSMRDFELCEDCTKEYYNTQDRRFHAEPLACPKCGPQIEFTSKLEGKKADSLNTACKAIDNGQIIAVKGIGGFHLICDAYNQTAISWLRQTKPRAHKPLAVMLLPAQLGEHSLASEAHIQQLISPVRPIVLCPKRPESKLPDSIAPGLNEIGIIFPYSPLHFLLMDQLQRPLVVTSANISGEPVITDSKDVLNRLSHLIDGVLDHNRPIRRPADDSVIQICAEKAHTLRIGRGLAPLELRSPYPLLDGETLLATGAQSKNTLCLSFANRLVVSPHIADMDSLPSQELFEMLATDFARLYQRTPHIIAHDAHPDYATSRWAKKQKVKQHAVYHHDAHASSLYAQTGSNDLKADETIIAFTWDGVGLGSDNGLWGGECLFGKPGQWQRMFHLKPFKIPGGDRAAREPWRIADSLRLHCGKSFKSNDPLLQSMWEQNINSPLTSAIGRLLDGCSALLGVCKNASFEGQAPMQLAAIAETSDTHKYIDLPIVGEEVIWLGLIKWLMRNQQDQAFAARVVHNTLAHSLLRQALLLSEQTHITTVGVSGGVFQNRLLIEHLSHLLPEHGLKLHHPQSVPVNDGGLCIGQAIEAAAVLKKSSKKLSEVIPA